MDIKREKIKHLFPSAVLIYHVPDDVVESCYNMM